MDELPWPRALKKRIPREFRDKWNLVYEVLPPHKTVCIVMVRGDCYAATGYFRYAAGDPYSPMFEVPQIKSLETRIIYHEDTSDTHLAKDVTHWWVPKMGILPLINQGHYSASYGLEGSSWVEYTPGKGPQWITWQEVYKAPKYTWVRTATRYHNPRDKLFSFSNEKICKRIHEEPYSIWIDQESNTAANPQPNVWLPLKEK